MKNDKLLNLITRNIFKIWEELYQEYIKNVKTKNHETFVIFHLSLAINTT